MKKQVPFKFGVNPCSLCEKIDLTVGQQKFGGIRYCQSCLKATFGWFQLSEENRNKITELFNTLRSNDTVIVRLKDAEKTTPEELKNISIGESKRRLMESLR
jgi:hypothetical protein